MKLIFAIVSSDDSSNVVSALVKNRFSATKLKTTGGFLSATNVTIIVGCEDEKVPEVIELIKEESKQRTEIIPTASAFDFPTDITMPLEVKVGGATIFVVNVEEFYKL